MKKATLFFIATTFCQIICAQKHDYIWVTGDDNQLVDTTYGGSTINFNSNPALAYYNYRELNLFTTNSSICDTAGNLLFYTNGCAIAGADDEILENGDNINPGSSHNLWCNQYKDGYAGGPQNSLILPLPDSTGVYYLFHKSFTIYNNPFDVISDKLMYSVIDMNQNNSKGKVIVKNQLLMTGALAHGEVVAAQTADSKDWWLVTPKRNSDTFYIFKFTKEGIVDTFQQTIGISPAPTGEGYGQTIFSPMGRQTLPYQPFQPCHGLHLRQGSRRHYPVRHHFLRLWKPADYRRNRLRRLVKWKVFVFGCKTKIVSIGFASTGRKRVTDTCG